MDTSTYWHSSYFRKMPVLHFVRMNSHNLTMGCEQSADSMFFPFCKFDTCWNALRFHTVCTVFVRNLQLERLRSRDPQSSWTRAVFRICPSMWGSCVLAHPAVSFLSPLGSYLIMYHYSAGNYNPEPRRNLTQWSRQRHFPVKGGRGAENWHITFPFFFQDASLLIPVRKKKFSLCMNVEGTVHST